MKSAKMELMRMFCYCFVLYSLFYLGHCEVTEVTSSNFPTIIKEKKCMFLYVTQSDCVKCKRLFHKFLIAAQTFEHDQDAFFGYVSDTTLIEAFEVSSFPEMVFYEYGSAVPSRFRAGISSGALIKVITQALRGDHRSVKRKHSVELTKSNFADVMDTDQQYRLVMLHEEDDDDDVDLFEEIAETFDNEESVVIARINISKERKLRQDFHTLEFPSIYWFPKGVVLKKKKRYGGKLDVDTLINFINKQAGLFRMKGGDLNPFAGLIKPIDEVLNLRGKDLYEIRNYDNIRKQVKEVIAKHPEVDDDLASFYLHLLDEVEEDGTIESLDESRNRVYRMIDGAWPLEYDQAIRKRNIVSKFIDIIGNHLLKEITNVDTGATINSMDYDKGYDGQNLEFHDEF